MENEQLKAIERSYGGSTLIPLPSVLLDKRHILIEGSIDSRTSSQIREQIMYLIWKNPDEDIWIHIDSPGGEINSGLAIYDVIQSYADVINLVCTGSACSMAAVILAGGKKGRRFILPNAETMVHEPLIGSQIGGSCSSVQAASDRLNSKRQLLNEILAKHTGKPLDEVEAATRYDHFFTAEESCEFGICDRIIEFRDMMEGI